MRNATEAKTTFDRLRRRLRLSAGDNSVDKIIALGGMLA